MGTQASSTRDQILVAAEAVFAEEGFAATRLEDVAEPVGFPDRLKLRYRDAFGMDKFYLYNQSLQYFSQRRRYTADDVRCHVAADSAAKRVTGRRQSPNVRLRRGPSRRGRR